ncbi:MAG: hypothetical protein IPL53_21020 [Ignavibacteria bacterium]|nr:hypothetical protein [Ignavibacteria bacterium]
MKTTNGGTNWVSLITGTNNPLEGVTFANANTGWAMGHYGTIIKTTNGGETWVSQISGTINYYFLSGTFIDGSTGWVVGGNGDSSIILNTTNGGTNWTSQIYYTPGWFNTITFTDANTGWAVDLAAIFKTTNGGTNWLSLTSEL